MQVGPHTAATCRLRIYPPLSTKINNVIAHCIELLIMEDGGRSLTLAKVTNPNIIKTVAKPPCITHPPN